MFATQIKNSFKKVLVNGNVKFGSSIKFKKKLNAKPNCVRQEIVENMSVVFDPWAPILLPTNIDQALVIVKNLSFYGGDESRIWDSLELLEKFTKSDSDGASRLKVLIVVQYLDKLFKDTLLIIAPDRIYITEEIIRFANDRKIGELSNFVFYGECFYNLFMNP